MNISTKRPSAGAAPRTPAPQVQLEATRKSMPQAPATGTASLTADAYLQHPKVLAFLQELKTEFGEQLDGVGGKRPLIVSDVIDDAGHQYVNLVQKGGGVLGIALVGYTHILEQAGIRFMRMAGTSAGAINTALLTSVGDPDNPKGDAKSGRLLEYLSNLEMFSFVDGHPFAKWLIRNFISDTDFMKRMKRLLTGLIGMLVLFFLLSLLLLGLEKRWEWTYAAALTRVSFVLTGLAFLLPASLGMYLARMFTRLRDSGYGINPGNTFLAWIRERMDENGVSTIDQLNEKAEKIPPTLKMRTGVPLGPISADVTFITSELVTQNKIEFPKMWRLFRLKAKQDELHPGEFVRASMSIPFFFESHVISGIPSGSPDVQQAWKDYFGCGEADIPHTVRFVDGGVLSNFPMSIFYNPDVAEARLPSLGIDLDDSDPNANNGDGAASWSIGNYCGRMLNTIRYYYDKDFLLKNSVFARGVGKVKLNDPKFNWLDFFLADQTKVDLFLQGAEAAKDFLLGFDWEDYKNARRKMHRELESKKMPQATTAATPIS